MSFSPTPEQRANLLKLATELAKMPNTCSSFRMDTYYTSTPVDGDACGDLSFDLAIDEHDIDHPCGTAACAIGWSPALLGIPQEPDDSWQRYASRVFGTCDTSSTAGSYMFGAHRGGGPQDAAERIMEVLGGEF